MVKAKMATASNMTTGAALDERFSHSFTIEDRSDRFKSVASLDVMGVVGVVGVM